LITNQASGKSTKEVRGLKKIVFLVIASLLVIGLVLPGCGGGGGGGAYTPIRELKTAGTLTIGVTGAMGFEQGLDAAFGAEVAAADVGSFSVGNQSLTVTIKRVETNEILDPGGASGTAAVASAIGQCDFMIGGFRTEGVVVYREPIMSANMTYLSCGVATESLAHSVITNYDRYQWFFRVNPFNDFLVSVMQSKIFTLAYALGSGYVEYINATYWHNLTYGFIPKVAIVAEDAEWSRVGRDKAMGELGPAGFNILVGQGLWLVNPLATDVTSTLNAIHTADPKTNIIYTILSGPVGTTFAKQANGVFPGTLLVGTNVEAQGAEFPSSTLGGCNMEIFTDFVAPGVNMTPQTEGFVSDFAAYAAAHSKPNYKWPIYTAGTFDAVKALVEALQAKGYVEGSTVKYVDTDIVSFMETNTREAATAKKTGEYPKWDGVTTGTFHDYPGHNQTGLPALNQGQVLAIYPWLPSAYFAAGGQVVPWTYDSDDWTMAPHTTHDLIFGTNWTVGIGSQWQWNGTQLVKRCVWPTTALTATAGAPLNTTYTIDGFISFENYLLGVDPTNTTAYGVIELMEEAGLWDQYGWYNFAYSGGGNALNLSAWEALILANAL
jgi:branched-chain amino acid transport system substrate-binding protein